MAIGLPVLIGVAIYVCSVLTGKIEKEENNRITHFFFWFGLIAFWMTSAYFPWSVIQKIPGLSSFFYRFQFAWRFLTIASVLWSLVAAVGFVRFFSMKTSWYCTLAVVSALVLTTGMIYMNQYTTGVEEYTTEDAMWLGEMDDLYLLVGHNTEEREDITTNVEGLEFYDCDRGSSQYLFSYRASESSLKKNSYVDIAINYYPGYTVLFDGEKVPYTASDGGLIRVNLNQKSSGTIQVFYEERTLFKVCDVVSVVSLLLFAGYLCVMVWKRGRKEAGR